MKSTRQKSLSNPAIRALLSMAIATPIVGPLAAAPAAAAPVVDPTAVAAAPVEAVPAADESAIPEEVLRIPAMQALFAGAPPAVSADIKEYANNPDSKIIAANADSLMKAGIGRYRSLKGDIGVLFNVMYIHPEEIKAADAAGKLQEIAPPFDSVNGKISKSGKNHPALTAKTPAGPKSAPMPAPPQFSSGGLPASAETSLTKARTKNLTPGSPTSGPLPGQGRVLNAIFKPTL